MIDAEAQIFEYLKSEVLAAYPDAYVTDEYVRQPPRMPCVSIEEKDNALWRNTRTGSIGFENHAGLLYEINVYSNKINGRKAEARAILNVVDEAFARKNFSRKMVSPIPNLADATIYRLTARYQAIVGPDGNGGFISHIR